MVQPLAPRSLRHPTKILCVLHDFVIAWEDRIAFAAQVRQMVRLFLRSRAGRSASYAPLPMSKIEKHLIQKARDFDGEKSWRTR